MKCVLCSFSIFILFHSLFAQAPDILWSWTYGRAGVDKGKDVLVLEDGGYLILGETTSRGAGAVDIWLLRTDSNGDTLWTRTYGGASDDEPSSIKATIDGGFIISASTESFGAGEDDFWLVKIDGTGNIQWQQTYGDSLIDYSTVVTQLSDGGYVLTGYTQATPTANPDARLLRMNSNGNLLWSRTFGAPNDHEAFYDVLELEDHGLLVCGYNEDLVNGNGSWDAWVVKTDSLGLNAVWDYYGGFGWEMAQAMHRTADGNFIFAGSTDVNFSIFTDYFLAKLTPSLDTLWTRHWGHASVVEEPFDLIITEDGGCVIAGQACVPGVGGCVHDLYLVKTSANGDSLWTLRIGEAQDDAALALKETCDGGLIVTGYQTSAGNTDVVLLRLNGDPAARVPRAPAQVTIRNIGNDVRLLWPRVTHSESNCAQATQEYRIYSDNSATGAFAIFVGATTDTFFVDSAAIGPTRKYYRVTATAP